MKKWLKNEESRKGKCYSVKLFDGMRLLTLTGVLLNDDYAAEVGIPYTTIAQGLLLDTPIEVLKNVKTKLLQETA